MNSFFLLLRLCCLFTSLLSIMPLARGQEAHQIPKNFPGLLAGVEWNTLSGVTGIEYDGKFLLKNNVQYGVKVSYIFRYQLGNMQLLNRPCCEMSNILSGLATATVFTSRERHFSGLFLEGAAGIGIKKRFWVHEVKETRARLAVEAGFGWLFPLGKGFAIKWTNTVAFPSKEAGITMTRIALGF